MRSVTVLKAALATAMAVLMSAALADAQPPRTDSDPAAESAAKPSESKADKIKALESNLADLIVHGNLDSYAAHLTPDYVHVRENGRIENKDETLAALRNVQRKIIFLEMEPAGAAVRIYGDTAICSAEFTETIRDSGQVKTRRIRQLDVLAKRDGQWLLAAGQSTLIGR